VPYSNTINTQLIYNSIYMHHKKKHTAKFNSHIFTIKMFPIIFPHMLFEGFWSVGHGPTSVSRNSYNVMVMLEVNFHIVNCVRLMRDPPNKYLLTPRSRVLLEKLTGFQPAKKFCAFYRT
jgi:hypothetical protein